MSKNISRIINEEIDRYVDKFELDSPKQVVAVLNELFALSTNKFMDNIGSVEADEKNAVASENWDMFIDSVTASIQDEPESWMMGLKLVKNKILTYKYFTKKDLIKKENLDGYLRLEIKRYFTALQNYVDAKDFLNKFFLLPSELLYNVIRYIFFLNDDLSKSIRVTNDNLKDNINNMLELRMKVAEKISKVSNGYADLLDLKELKDLYDNGVLFEDNFINRGISEFVVKLLNHKGAMGNMIDVHPGSMLNDLKNLAENSSAYIEHISALRNESDEEYFSVNGEQIGKRFDNQLDIVKGKSFEGYVVDGKSRLKEPKAKIAKTDMPWETNPSGGGGAEGGPDGGSGGGASGGGGGDFSSGFGNSDFGGEFAEPGEEGEVPGAEGEVGGEEGGEGTIGQEPDGTPMPETEEGVPEDFGTQEDNTPPAENKTEKPEEIK